MPAPTAAARAIEKVVARRSGRDGGHEKRVVAVETPQNLPNASWSELGRPLPPPQWRPLLEGGHRGGRRGGSASEAATADAPPGRSTSQLVRSMSAALSTCNTATYRGPRVHDVDVSERFTITVLDALGRPVQTPRCRYQPERRPGQGRTYAMADPVLPPRISWRTGWPTPDPSDGSFGARRWTRSLRLGGIVALAADRYSSLPRGAGRRLRGCGCPPTWPSCDRGDERVTSDATLEHHSDPPTAADTPESLNEALDTWPSIRPTGGLTMRSG